MYGLVNKAIEDMVLQKFGAATWEEIKRRAGVDVDVFIRMEGYPDDITYNLVDAASEVLNMPKPTVLQEFGRFWVMFTGKTAYGPLLNSAGSTMKECLLNLDQLHLQVGLALPDLAPPSFSVIDVSVDTFKVRYKSERKGLAPMVVGLLVGLGELYDEPVCVTMDETESVDTLNTTFTVKYI